MLIKKLKTPKVFKQTESVNIAAIVREVKQHGFYSAHCASLVLNAQSDHDLIEKIQVIAASVHLTVSFNAAGDLCIFEAIDD